jgi:hypothetical protein
MGATETARDALFGNPPVANKEPSREGVLAAFSELERAVSGAVAGIVYYATGTARAADTARPVGTIGKAENEPNYYRREGDGWVIDNSVYDGVAGLVQPLVSQAEAARDEAAALVAPFLTSLKPAAERLSDGSYYEATDLHYRWSVGVQSGSGEDVAADINVSAVQFDVELSASVDKIGLRVFSRPTSPDTYDVKPGSGVDDVLLHEDLKDLPSLNLTATGAPLQPLLYRFPTFATQAGFTYLFEITSYDASSVATGSGISRNATSGTGLTQQQRGFFDVSGAIAGSAALAWKLGNIVYMLDGDSDQAEPYLDTRLRIETASAEATGLAVTITGTASLNGASSSFSGTLNLAAPATGNVTDEAVTLTSPQGLATPAAFFNPLGKLDHANVTSVVVRDAGTNALLSLGSDYLLNPYSGVVSLPGAGSARAVKVDYHWSLCRYDVVCLHAETNDISAVDGEERTTDSGEYVPALPSSALVPLFNARVADGFPVDLIPVWYLDGSVHRDLLAARSADFARQRRALAPILRMAARGETIRVAMVGDSIAAQEATPGPNGTPNTAARDRPEYFADNIGADRIAELPLYDTGDGAGQVHTRASSAWGLVRALQDLGAVVEFYNFAMGGTTSGTGSRNGMDPVLRAGVWAVTPHLLVTHYGMNETGSNDTEANLRDLFDAAYANGVLSVFAIGMPRPSPFKPFSMDGVRKTWRATRRAAEFYNPTYGRSGAFMDPARLVDDDYLGAMGVSILEYGSADRFHHPGIREGQIYGNEIHALVCGQ